MIDFATLKPALLALAKSLTGLSVATMENEPRVMAKPSEGAVALVSFFGVAGVGGTDAKRYDRDTASEWGQGGDTEILPEGGAEPPVLETVIGRRELTIRIKVDGIFQDANRDARFYLERMRTRLSWESTRVALLAAGLGFQEVLLATTADEKRDNRLASIALVDVRCNVVSSEQDPTLHPTIERVDTPRRVS